ncbi:MAG TPA: ABC transporter substrate-binding protein [Candidatus Limnocylindrales bacterium]
MRIVSLLPAATEIAWALGLGDELVGLGHDADWPPEARAADVPLMTAVGPDGPILDQAALGLLEPDLVLVGETLPTGRDAAPLTLDALRAQLPEATVLRLAPLSVEGILNAITTVGAMAEAEDEAIGLVELLRERLVGIEERVRARREAGAAPRRTVVLDGLTPPRAAGRWVPEQVRRAGGWDVLGGEGEPSRPIDWDDLRDVDPAIVVVAAPDGLAAAAARWRVERPEWWPELEAVRRGAVFAVEGGLLLRGGPRVVDGVAALAELLDPDGFEDTAPLAGWIPLDPAGR